MKNRRILTAAAAVSAALLMLIGASTAYFTDVEFKDNVITIGNVSIVLTEEHYNEPSGTIVPGTRLTKDPKITNNGNKDEFVFMKVTVPKGNVTLLNTSGTAIEKPKSQQELFRFIADNATLTTAAVKDGLNVSGVQGTNAINTAETDVDFYYHNGTTTNATTPGWLLIKAEAKSETENGKTVYYDEYIFGYNKKLAPGDETAKLFDGVQLKSFIDGEVTGDTVIGVYGYGIQADNLKFNSNVVDLTKTYFDLSDLKTIYTIVKNKSDGKKNIS